MISGCSGGGKSALLQALARRGHPVVPEPGRRIIAAVRDGRGGALPWDDPRGFARHAIGMAQADRAAADDLPGWVFFDRGLVDAAAALAAFGGGGGALADCRGQRYHDTVFMAPPWPEIFEADADRRHEFQTAVGEWDRLNRCYAELGYRLVELPKIGVEERADFILGRLGPPPDGAEPGVSPFRRARRPRASR